MRYIFVIAALILTSCANRNEAPQVPEKPLAVAAPISIEAKQVAARSGTSLVTEVVFAVKSTHLPIEGQKQISSLLRSAKAAGKIDEVKVVVWGDQEYPLEKDKKLSEEQTKLAEERGQAIEVFLKDRDVSKTDIINMTVRPNSWDRLLQSDDYRMKKALEEVGLPGKDTHFKSTPKQRRALVIVLTKK